MDIFNISLELCYFQFNFFLNKNYTKAFSWLCDKESILIVIEGEVGDRRDYM